MNVLKDIVYLYCYLERISDSFTASSGARHWRQHGSVLQKEIVGHSSSWSFHDAQYIRVSGL